jgi:hypothetical protein
LAWSTTAGKRTHTYAYGPTALPRTTPTEANAEEAVAECSGRVPIALGAIAAVSGVVLAVFALLGRRKTRS